jgi:hypothetical protein
VPKRTTLYLNEEVYLKLKGLALEKNTSMNAVVQELIMGAPEPEGRLYKAWIKEHGQKKGKK